MAANRVTHNRIVFLHTCYFFYIPGFALAAAEMQRREKGECMHVNVPVQLGLMYMRMLSFMYKILD